MTDSYSTPFLSNDRMKVDEHLLAPIQETVQESLNLEHSDGLEVFRRRPWFSSQSYTRADCRCGHCPWNDPEPCPYAVSAGRSVTVEGGYLATMKRSLGRALTFDRKEKH